MVAIRSNSTCGRIPLTVIRLLRPYWLRFTIHAEAVYGTLDVRVEAWGAGVDRAAETVLFDQPLDV
jgi:hypothetical protein